MGWASFMLSVWSQFFCPPFSFLTFAKKAYHRRLCQCLSLFRPWECWPPFKFPTGQHRMKSWEKKRKNPNTLGSLQVRRRCSTSSFHYTSTTTDNQVCGGGQKSLDLGKDLGPHLVGPPATIFPRSMNYFNVSSVCHSSGTRRVQESGKETNLKWLLRNTSSYVTHQKKKRQLLVRWYKCDNKKQIEGGVGGDGTVDRRQISDSKHQHTILTNPMNDICKTILIK